MKVKFLIAALLLTSLFSFTTPGFGNSGSINTKHFKTFNKPDERTELILIDGIWWWIVYDTDGKVIDLYKCEE